MTFYNLKFQNNWNNCVGMRGNLVNRNILLIKLSGAESVNRFGYVFLYTFRYQVETLYTFRNMDDIL